jgi:hypothetical protein
MWCAWRNSAAAARELIKGGARVDIKERVRAGTAARVGRAWPADVRCADTGGRQDCHRVRHEG